MLRHQRLHDLASGIPGKLVSRLASPGMLLAAAGTGVIIEQSGQERGWSGSVFLQAATAFIGLLLSRPSPAPQAGQRLRTAGAVSASGPVLHDAH